MATILIVDDDAVDRELAARCLEAVEELRVVEAEDGPEALEAVSRYAPDVVLTDLRMPGMDGFELVEELREDFPQLPVILMTSQGNERVAAQALRAGAASYVPKSDMKPSLASTVEQLLELGRARRSRQAVLRYFGERDTRFALANDPALISPLVAYFQEGLERLGLGDDAVRTHVGVALMEALTNAMIHGNLEVGSELREDGGAYRSLIARRREEPPYAGRRVACSARESAERLEYVVEDEGPGFDHRALPDPTDPENMVRVHGRGLLLIRTFMDEVRFNERGNRIEMTKRL